MKENTTICDHCGGNGRCSCDECRDADMFRPDYSQIPSLKWSSKDAPCSVCGGRGRIEISESTASDDGE
jgi:hypothetical protein